MLLKWYMDLVSSIRGQGFAFLEKALSDNELYYELLQQMQSESEDEALHQALIEALVGEGRKRLQEKKTGKESGSPVLLWLKNPEIAKRLRELVLTSQGIQAMVHAAENSAGEFLIFEPMATDYLLAHAFVNTLLVNPNGRKLVIGLVQAAAGNEIEKMFVPKFPKAKKTGEGEKFEKYFSSEKGIAELEERVKKENGTETLLAFLQSHESEACGILKDALANEKINDALVQFLLTEAGRKLCAAIGKSGFGRKIGAGYLWFTKGGRLLVKKLLVSFEGHESVYAIMTGMTRAEFIAATVKL